MADREQVALKNRRKMEAGRTLEGMFPDLENRDRHKKPSNTLNDFTVVRKFAPYNFKGERDSWQLQRTDDPDRLSVMYALSSIDGSTVHRFPVSDIEKLDVQNREVVIESSSGINSPATIINESGEHKEFPSSEFF